MTANARDVIARALLADRCLEEPNHSYAASLPGWDEAADAVIAALNAAGFEIVQRDAWKQRYDTGYTDGGNSALADVLLFLEDEFDTMPEMSDVLQIVAKKVEEFTWPVKRDAPLPPTPGPFNPFGKQDGED